MGAGVGGAVLHALGVAGLLPAGVFIGLLAIGLAGKIYPDRDIPVIPITLPAPISFAICAATVPTPPAAASIAIVCPFAPKRSR